MSVVDPGSIGLLGTKKCSQPIDAFLSSNEGFTSACCELIHCAKEVLVGKVSEWPLESISVAKHDCVKATTPFDFKRRIQGVGAILIIKETGIALATKV